MVLSPYPPDESGPDAGRRYLAQHLVELASAFDVIAFFPAGREPLTVRSSPTPKRLEVRPVPTNPRPPFSHGVLRRSRNALLGLTPGSGVRRDFLHCDAVRDALNSADIAELQWAQFLPFVPSVRRRWPRLPLVAFEYDVHYQSLYRMAKSAHRRQLRCAARLSAPLVRRLEPRLLNRCDVVQVFSAKDESLLRHLGVRKPIHVVPPIIDLPVTPATLDGPPIALFVGAMWRWENHEAIATFIAECWPGIRAAVPGARLVVAGAGPPKDMATIRRPDVLVTGFVDDLDPLYRSARVFVAPLRAGAGVKFKVVQAMAYGLPVVTTSVGAEGIVEETGAGAFVAVTDSPTEFRAATIEALRNPPRSVADAARTWAVRSCSREASIRSTLHLYEELADSSRMSS